MKEQLIVKAGYESPEVSILIDILQLSLLEGSIPVETDPVEGDAG